MSELLPTSTSGIPANEPEVLSAQWSRDEEPAGEPPPYIPPTPEQSQSIPADSLADSVGEPTVAPSIVLESPETSNNLNVWQDFLPILPTKVSSLIFIYACQLDVNSFPFAFPFAFPIPISSLPPKSLNNPPSPSPRSQAPKRRFCPLWLGRICKAWRDLAWSVPEIWTTIVIRMLANAPESVEIQTELLGQWLGRSEGRLLDVYLVEEVEENHSVSMAMESDGNANALEMEMEMEKDGERNDGAVERLLALLSSHSHRWRTIDFHLPYRRYQYLVPPSTNPPLHSPTATTPNTQENDPDSGHNSRPNRHRLSFPHLQNASIHWFNVDHHQKSMIQPHLPIDLSSAASSLRGTLSLSHILTKNDLFLHFPTPHITRLVLTQVVRIVPRQLFERFPLLQELTLDRCSAVRKLEPESQDARRGPGGPRPITHRTLKVLSITAESEFLFNLLVHQLALPALETLHLCVCAPVRCTKFLLPFIRRSTCHALTHLTIESSVTADYDLLELLALQGVGDAIRELRVWDHDLLNPERRRELKRNKEKGPLPGLGNRFFEHFHPYAYPAFLPSLEVFEYRGLLAVEEVSFLEGLIIRSRVRERDVVGVGVQSAATSSSRIQTRNLVDQEPCCSMEDGESDSESTHQELEAGGKVTVTDQVDADRAAGASASESSSDIQVDPASAAAAATAEPVGIRVDSANSADHSTSDAAQAQALVPLAAGHGLLEPDWTVPVAILRRVEIHAEHVSGMEMITEFEDAEYVWEVIRMVEEGVLVLVDGAGMPWM